MARRANKKFIIQMTVIGLVLTIGLFLAGMWKLVWSKNPLPYVKAGDEAMAAGRYEDAVENFAKAIKLKDLDINVWIKLGDAQNYLASSDFNNVLKAQQIWEASLGQDPNFLLAHQRLLKHYGDLADAFGGSRRIAFLDRTQNVAKNILRIKPDDAEAKRVLQMSIIEMWLAGQSANDPMKITEAIAELRKTFAGSGLIDDL
ncbi:MAG TPA: hypothetical protein PLD59_09605, partial [Tepidisphaeraceae bacterium]|nr:hypothetical protein [Tepidisphaeraceae bacterium]